jgi:hypothetical protein
MLTLTLRVTQKHVFRPPKIKTPFVCHESLSPKFSHAKKKYGAMLKRERDTHEALKIAKEKKKKNGTHEGSKVLKKRHMKLSK